MMQESHAEDKQEANDHGIPDIPNIMPAPSLDILSNYDAMEAEGAKLLDQDPTNFFFFDNNNNETDSKKKNKHKNNNNDTTTNNNNNSSATLGKPTRLRDPLRDDSPTHTPFPQIIGRVPKADTRTEREKKRDEKERKMWAAAQAEVASGIEFAAEEDRIHLPGNKDVDYNEVGNMGDAVDREWEEGLDPETDAELLSTPKDRRYTEEDVDWIIGKLEEKVKIQDEISQMSDDEGGGGKQMDDEDDEDEEDPSGKQMDDEDDEDE